MSSPEIAFHHHTREEIARYAQSGAVAIIPLAATEQHGPHLPVYTDSLVCEHLVNRAAALAASTVPLLVTPMLPIGCSQHHLAFGGTISFAPDTYYRVLMDIGESLIQCGFRRLIFLNGHGGNEAMMIQAANELAVRHPVWTAAASYWNVARAALQEAASAIGAGGMIPGHAGEFETSLIAAIRPDLVREDQLSAQHPELPWLARGLAGVFVGKHGFLTGSDGYTDPPHQADASKGAAFADAVVDALADWLCRTYKELE